MGIQGLHWLADEIVYNKKGFAVIKAGPVGYIVVEHKEEDSKDCWDFYKWFWNHEREAALECAIERVASVSIPEK